MNFWAEKVVLVFYVSAFTATCTKEVCTFRDSTDRFTDLGAQVIGVSVNDPFSNKEFSEKNRLPYPILSDYKREIIKKYGLEMPDYAGLNGYVVAKRSIFIINQKGIIQYMWISENPTIEPNYEQIQQELAKIPK